MNKHVFRTEAEMHKILNENFREAFGEELEILSGKPLGVPSLDETRKELGIESYKIYPFGKPIMNDENNIFYKNIFPLDVNKTYMAINGQVTAKIEIGTSIDYPFIITWKDGMISSCTPKGINNLNNYPGDWDIIAEVCLEPNKNHQNEDKMASPRDNDQFATNYTQPFPKSNDYRIKLGMTETEVQESLEKYHKAQKRMKDNLNHVASHVSATDLLLSASELIKSRGTERDKPNGERSMKRCVEAYNAMTGHNLTEVDGWLFMQYLKHARSREGAFRRDDYEDDIAYSALKAEAAINGRDCENN